MTREEVFRESGEKGEARVQQWMQENGYSDSYYTNVILRYYGFIEEIASTEIDGLLLLTGCLIVFEIKNWHHIKKYDSKNDKYLVPIKKNERHLDTPKWQNNSHINKIHELLGIPLECIVGICLILTDDGSDMQHVHVEHDYGHQQHIIRFDQIEMLINEYEKKNSDSFDREKYIKRIEMSNWGDWSEYREEHIKYSEKARKCRKEGVKAFGYYKCDYCGSQLVLGKKNGYYAKCTGYGRICNHRTIPIDEIENYAVSNTTEIAERLIYRMTEMEYIAKIQKYNAEISSLKSSIKCLKQDILNQKMELSLIKQEIEEKCYKREKKIFEDELCKRDEYIEQLEITLSQKNDKICTGDRERKELYRLNHELENLYKQTFDYKICKIISSIFDRFKTLWR